MKRKIKITKASQADPTAWWNSRVGDVIEATEEKPLRQFLVKLEPGVNGFIDEGYCEIVRATTLEEFNESLPTGMRGLLSITRAGMALADYILEFYQSDPYVSLDGVRIKHLLDEYGNLKKQKPLFDEQLEESLNTD